MAERGRGRTQGVAGTWPPREAAPAGGFAPSGLRAWPWLVAKLREWIGAEAGAGRLLPWVPVAFGTGIAFYFTADHEPVASVAAVAAAALCVAAFLLRRQRIFPAAVMIAAMAAGFATATWKTALIAHGVLARPMYAVSLSGFVEARDIRERTDRFVLRVTQMESPRSQMKLQRVRLSVRNGTAPDVGSFVELKARLQPPLAPLRPGSYDFGRDMFFQGIGASGFVTGAIKTLEAPRSGGLSLRYAATRQQQIKQSRGKRRRRRPFFDRISDGQLRDQRQQRAYREENHSGYDRHVIAGYRQHVAKPGALASLVAGLATTPYAAFHFHRVTPYGVLANLAAMPAVSAVVMPAGMLGLVAMPFGFDGVFWRIMGSGIDWMIVVTQWVAVPGAIGRMADFGIGPLIAASIGIVLLGLLRTPLRWLGAAVLLLSVIWAVTVPQPEIMISADGHNVGVRGRDGRLHIIRSAKDAFLLKEWLAADADARLPTDSSLAEGVSEMAGGGFVALALRPEALADDCERAALVVTTRPAPASCPSPVMSGDRLRSQGAMTLRRTAAGFAIDAVRPKGVTRPWSPGPAGDSETEAALAPRSKVPRAVDATPAEADQQAED